MRFHFSSQLFQYEMYNTYDKRKYYRKYLRHLFFSLVSCVYSSWDTKDIKMIGKKKENLKNLRARVKGVPIIVEIGTPGISGGRVGNAIFVGIAVSLERESKF